MLKRLVATPVIVLVFTLIWLKAVLDDDEVEINVYDIGDDDGSTEDDTV